MVEGYSTIFAEVDRQVDAACGKAVTMAVVSVGVGSWAQAVTKHYRSEHNCAQVVTVESEKAPCLNESLRCGEITPVATEETIMCGMNCGTVSFIAWPDLRQGVSTSVVVTDLEAHECVQFLQQAGLDVGPCGAAPLSAVRRMKSAGLLKPDPEAVVVLFSTEGMREYDIPS